MSGVDLNGTLIRKGAADAIVGGSPSTAVTSRTISTASSSRSRRAGGTPLLLPAARDLGVVHLKDVVKEGMRERFGELRASGSER